MILPLFAARPTVAFLQRGCGNFAVELIDRKPSHRDASDAFVRRPATDGLRDKHKQGCFSDFSRASVRQCLSMHSNVHYAQGFVSELLAIVGDLCGVFVLLRAHGGRGVILFGDHGYASCPSVRAAVAKFFSGKLEVRIVLSTRQCMAQKL